MVKKRRKFLKSGFVSKITFNCIFPRFLSFIIFRGVKNNEDDQIIDRNLGNKQLELEL